MILKDTSVWLSAMRRNFHPLIKMGWNWETHFLEAGWVAILSIATILKRDFFLKLSLYQFSKKVYSIP